MAQEDQSSSSNTSAISEYHTAGSSISSESANSRETTPSTSSYYSTRIRSMFENKSNLSGEAEFEVEYFSDHHYGDSNTNNDSARMANREEFEKLKEHPQWGGFSKTVKVEVSQNISESAQAEYYDAIENGHKSRSALSTHPLPGVAWKKRPTRQPKTLRERLEESYPEWEHDKSRWICRIGDCTRSFVRKSLLVNHRGKQHNLSEYERNIPDQRAGKKGTPYQTISAK